MDKFEEILTGYIRLKGIEKTISQIVFCFLEKIGILWQADHINPAQEHLVTNVIRQKLIAGIEGVIASQRSDKTVLLFLPEGEHHELGLLFMHYLLKEKGIKIIYLGCNATLNDVEFVCHLKKPNYLYSHLTTVGQGFNFDKFITNMAHKFCVTPVIISGQLTHTYKKKLPSSIVFKKSLSETIEFVDTL